MQYLTSDGVNLKAVKALAKQCEFALWPNERRPVWGKKVRLPIPEHINVAADEITDEKLNDLFRLPIENIIDANVLPESAQSFLEYKAKNKKAHQKSIGFLLTCPVIYSCDVAKIFVNALSGRLNFSKNRFDTMQLALHEALVNGLIHGNLQMGSELRQSARDFVEYSRILNERLCDPAYARKSISIWATWTKKRLEIKIRDEGAGYSIENTMQKMPELKAKSGRGLKLIAGTADSCTIDDFGREITMSFIVSSEEHYQVTEPLVEEKKKNQDADAGDLSSCRVLVMEDNPSNQTLVVRLLNSFGIYDIDLASDGIEGLKKVAANMPDLIILDITMPRMNGYEVLHRLKSAPQTKDIPVLIQTASDNRETRDKTFSSGATDFISKPINPLEFFSRVKVHLENRMLVQKLEGQLLRLDEELMAAQRMQRDMLPNQKALDDTKMRYDLDISHSFEPSLRLGGDFWQLFPVSSTQVAVYLCDFSGHGVAAALNTVRLHTLITQMNKNLGYPSGFLQKINAQLFDLLPRGQFATFFCAIIDVERHTMTYSGAGSPPPFLCHDGKIQQLYTAGIPLGISSRPTYDDFQVPFMPGDTLLMFSDAFTESPNTRGERLGNEGFMHMVEPALCEQNASAGIKEIMTAFLNYAETPVPDDATAVLIRYVPHD